MLKIAICDDNLEHLKHYHAMLSGLINQYGIPAEIKTYESAEQLLFLLEDKLHCPDLLYLDIHMPGKDGLAAAYEIREQEYPTTLIFLTRSEDNILDAFDVNAFHYIIKEKTEPEKFERIFLEACKQVEHKQLELIELECAGEVRQIPMRSVRYFEVYRKIITVYYEDKTFQFNGALNRLEELLVEKGFLRISKSCLVSMHYMARATFGKLTLLDGTELSIGRSYWDDVKLIMESKQEQFQKV